MCMQTITSGIRACGIYPFNPDSILKERLVPSDKGDKEGNELNSKSSSNDVSDLTRTPIQSRLPTLPGGAIQNPLVTSGFISPNLANILLKPNISTEKQNSSRVIIKERVLTDKEWIDKIAEKLLNKRKKKSH